MEPNNENKQTNFEEVFKDLYKSEYLKNYAKRVAGNEWEELFSECISILYEKGEDRLIEMIEAGYLHQFMFFTIRNQISDKNKTAFRKNFRDDNLIFDDNQYEDIPFEDNYTIKDVEVLDYINSIIDKDLSDNKNTYFYHAKLLRYLLDENLDAWKISKRIGIPYTSVRHTLKVYRKHLKKLKIEFINNNNNNYNEK